jgi:hypothetical protein
MKKLFFYTLMIISSLACSKDEMFEKGSQVDGFCNGKKNGSCWESSCSATYFKKKNFILIVGNTFTAENEAREGLFLELPLELNQYKIDENNQYAISYFRFDADVVVGAYETDTNEKNVIKIDEIDKDKKTVKGTFCAYLKKSNGRDEFIEKIKFTKGCFEVKYVEK